MMRIALFFADGRAYFLGLAIIAIAAIIALRLRRRILTHCLVIAGVACIVLSSTPAPIWIDAVLAIALVVWVCVFWRRSGKASERFSVAVVGAACVLATAIEFPHHVLPSAGPDPGGSVYVIGDSLSAGVRRGETTWPKVLRDEGFAVRDLSQAGATVATAMAQARRIEVGPATVIVEIGGNDLLGKTSSRDFEKGLETLLRSIVQDGRRVIMFELPLPPFAPAYGRIQRGLAARFQVQLMPKRVLAGVLGMPSGTIDGLHLSEAGHRGLAATIECVLGGR